MILSKIHTDITLSCYNLISHSIWCFRDLSVWTSLCDIMRTFWLLLIFCHCRALVNIPAHVFLVNISKDFSRSANAVLSNMGMLNVTGYCQNAPRRYQFTAASEQSPSPLSLTELVSSDFKNVISLYLDSLFCSLDLFLIHLPVPHCLNYYGFINLDIRGEGSPSLFFIISILGSLHFCRNCRVACEDLWKAQLALWMKWEWIYRWIWGGFTFLWSWVFSPRIMLFLSRFTFIPSVKFIVCPTNFMRFITRYLRAFVAEIPFFTYQVGKD